MRWEVMSSAGRQGAGWLRLPGNLDWMTRWTAVMDPSIMKALVEQMDDQSTADGID